MILQVIAKVVINEFLVMLIIIEMGRMYYSSMPNEAPVLSRKQRPKNVHATNQTIPLGL